MSIEFHRRMLADRVRHDAFRAALERTIRPGHSTVADIGAGTGVLAFFARQLGAREVWLYDPGAALGLAEVVAARNGIDGLNFVSARSLDVDDPTAAASAIVAIAIRGPRGAAKRTEDLRGSRGRSP